MFDPIYWMFNLVYNISNLNLMLFVLYPQKLPTHSQKQDVKQYQFS